MSGFSNPVVGGGGDLIRDSIHSPDYVPGASGWTINQDGTAEFNGLTARGTVEVGPDNGFQIVIRQVTSAGVIQIYTHAATEGIPGVIEGFIGNPGAANEWMGLAMEGPRHPIGAADDTVLITLNSQNADNTSQANIHLDWRDGTTGNAQVIASFDKNKVQITKDLQVDAGIIKPAAIVVASSTVAGLARNTNHRVQLDSSMLDTDGGFDPVNHRYVFPRVGVWRVSYTVTMDTFSSITQPTYAEAWLDVNVSGSRYARAAAPVAAANQVAALTGSTLIRATATTDFVDLWTRFTNGAVGSSYAQTAGNIYPQMSIEFVGSP